MESNFDAALRVTVTNILCDLLGIKKPGDVLLAEVLPEAILRDQQVCAIANFSHATLWRRVKAGTFPPPVKLGDDRKGAAPGWLASEVVAWMRSLRPEESEQVDPLGSIDSKGARAVTPASTAEVTQHEPKSAARRSVASKESALQPER
jgi:predicted DNA-binding transcriptional regulator AlpA